MYQGVGLVSHRGKETKVGGEHHGKDKRLEIYLQALCHRNGYRRHDDGGSVVADHPAHEHGHQEQGSGDHPVWPAL